MKKLKNWFIIHKITAILVVVIILIMLGGFFVFRNNSCTGPSVSGSLLGLGGKGCIFFGRAPSDPSETELNFDSEGPYAQLFPRRDGNALVLNLKRTSSYAAISYELTYTSRTEEVAVEGTKIKKSSGEESGEGAIDRGVQGTIDTKDKKGEYEQEILFGTCSKNVCKYDKGVENGTLILHIRKGNQAYKMITLWHLQRPDVALGVLTSGDNHFIYKVEADRQTLSNIGYSIINDLTGVPKLLAGKVVLGKVYALNVAIAKSLPAGEISLELADNPPAEAKIFRFDNEWQELETKINGSKLSAKADGAGIFAVLIPSK